MNDALPDGVTEAEAVAFEAALDFIADPGAVLARAAALDLEADAIHAEMPAATKAAQADGYDHDAANRLTLLSVQQRGALDLAALLVSIAETALAVKDHEGGRLADDMFADDIAEDVPDDDGPHALACRFVADLVGESKARVGDREMLFVRYTGWIDLSEAPLHTDEDGLQSYRITGRAVSRYNDRVLVITDGGTGMVLPADLVTLEPDE